MGSALKLTLVIWAILFTSNLMALDQYKTRCFILDDNFEKSECSFTVAFNNPKSFEEYIEVKEKGNGLSIESSNCKEQILPDDIEQFTSVNKVLRKIDNLANQTDYANSYEISGIKLKYQVATQTLHIEGKYQTDSKADSKMPEIDDVIYEYHSRWSALNMSEESKLAIYKQYLFNRKLAGAIYTTNAKEEIEIKQLIKCQHDSGGPETYINTAIAK